MALAPGTRFGSYEVVEQLGSGGMTVIVMELVEGPTLEDRIKEGPLPPDEAMSMVLQIISALEVAHGRQIVHCDLKPANVKVREDGTVKVLDFGISKPIDASTISGGTPVQDDPFPTVAKPCESAVIE